MSSTTCQIYFADTFTYNITSHYTDITASCSGTDCTLIASNGDEKEVTCNGILQYAGAGAKVEDSGYICACGSDQITIPTTYNCADLCYNLDVSSQCNFLTLNNGFLNGSPTNAVTSDTCSQYRCAGDGSNICTNDGATEYVCDNSDREYLLSGISASMSYVCNCNGPATVPDIYGGGTGTACGQGSSNSNSSPSPSPTTGSGSSGSGSGSGEPSQSSPISKSNSNKITLKHSLALASLAFWLIHGALI
ncbi:hypothetical protein TWF694_011343 [Orbilia ellipsospora]|uniref:Uncharacterized protein n=1 Tax=Orbilia ellipsospora TaxID=2528407 RepID=A0AAV9X511_9PEZI